MTRVLHLAKSEPKNPDNILFFSPDILSAGYIFGFFFPFFLFLAIQNDKPLKSQKLFKSFQVHWIIEFKRCLKGLCSL